MFYRILLLCVKSANREKLTDDADHRVNRIDKISYLGGIVGSHNRIKNQVNYPCHKHEPGIFAEGKQTEQRNRQTDYSSKIIQSRIIGIGGFQHKLDKKKAYGKANAP